MKSKFAQAGAVFEFSSIPKGYAAMNLIENDSGICILEGSPVSPGKFLMTLDGEALPLEGVTKKINERFAPFVTGAAFLNPLNETLFLGLYGLLKTSLLDLLIVLEASTASLALDITNKLLNEMQVTLIEIRSPRGIGGKSVSFLTSKSDLKSELSRTLSSTKCTFEILENLTGPLRSYFDLTV